MTRLETNSHLQNQENAPETSVDISQKLETLQQRLQSWKDILAYAEKNVAQNTEMVDMMRLTDAEKAAKKAKLQEDFAKSKAEYMDKIRETDQQLEQARRDMESVKTRDEAVRDAQRENAEVKSDAFLLEKTIAQILRSYPQLKDQMPAAQSKLLSLEETVDTIQKDMQSRKQVQGESALLAQYKDVLQTILQELANMPEQDTKTTEAAILAAINSKVDAGNTKLRTAYKAAFEGKGVNNGGSVTPQDAANRIGQVYAQGQQATKQAGLQNEIANMQVAFARDALQNQQTAKEAVIKEKLTAYEPLKLDPSIASNEEVRAIITALAQKAGDPAFNPSGLIGLISAFGMERNTDVENALLGSMGADKLTNKNELGNLVAIVAFAVTVAELVTLAANNALVTFKGLALALVAGWGALMGDLKLGNLTVLKSISQQDINLYVQYAQRAKKLESATPEERMRLNAEMKNIALLLQQRSLTTQRAVVDAKNDWIWEGYDKGQIDKQLQDIVGDDTDGILPLHEKYMNLTAELGGRDLKDPALKGKVDELLSLEQQLRDKGVDMLSYMDYVRRATGVQVKLPDNADYFSGLRNSMSAQDLSRLISSGEYQTYLQSLGKNKEQMGEQAAAFVRRALTTLKDAGIAVNVDTTTLDKATTPDDRFRASLEAFKLLQTQLDAQLKDAPSYEGLITKIEQEMADRNDDVYAAYKQVKEAGAAMSSAEARAILQPKIEGLYQLITIPANIAHYATLTIVSADPANELAKGALAQFASATTVEQMLHVTAEMYGAAHNNVGLGDSARELQQMYAQRYARQDIATLGSALEDYNKFYGQLSRETEAYSTLADTISSSPAEKGPKDKLRGILNSYQANLLTVQQSLTQFSEQQMASLLGDSSRRGVSESFGDYSRAARAFVAGNNLEGLRKEMQATLQQMESATPEQQDQLAASFDSKFGEPMRASFQKVKDLYDKYKAEIGKFDAASKNGLSREIYNEQTSYRGLQKSAAEGYTEQELQRPDIKKYVEARNAYRQKLLQLNGTMANFYGVSSSAELKRVMENPTQADWKTIDRLLIIDETAFDDRRDAASSELVPTNAADVQKETARMQRMLDRASAYANLLDRMGPLAKVQGNRDDEIIARLRGLKFLSSHERGTRLPNAFTYSGVILESEVTDDAIRFLDPGHKLANPKKELAGLMNTLVLLGSSRGREGTVNQERGHETYADTVINALARDLPRFRQNLAGYSKNVEGYSEASFIANFVEEKDIFEMARNLRPIDNVPANSRFINLGIDGRGSRLVVRNNDKRFYTADIVKNVDGVEVAYTVFIKQGCMNVQVPAQNVLKIVRQLRTKLNLPQIGREMPRPDMPQVTREVALAEARELKILVERNQLQIPLALLTLLASLVPGTPLIPEKPGETTPQIPPEITPKPDQTTPHVDTQIPPSTPSTGTGTQTIGGGGNGVPSAKPDQTMTGLPSNLE